MSSSITPSSDVTHQHRAHHANGPQEPTFISHCPFWPNLLILGTAEGSLHQATHDMSTIKLLAGSIHKHGYNDGSPLDARFSRISGICEGKPGAEIFIADQSNHAIRKYCETSVSTIIGGKKEGHKDGDAAVAEFCNPVAISFISPNGLLVTELNQPFLRRITLSDTVEVHTLRFSIGPPNGPHGSFSSHLHTLSLIEHSNTSHKHHVSSSKSKHHPHGEHTKRRKLKRDMTYGAHSHSEYVHEEDWEILGDYTGLVPMRLSNSKKEDPAHCIFVCSLADEVDESALKSHFGGIGVISSIRFSESHVGWAKFALIEFESKEGVAAARALHMTRFQGALLSVQERSADLGSGAWCPKVE